MRFFTRVSNYLYRKWFAIYYGSVSLAWRVICLTTPLNPANTLITPRMFRRQWRHRSPHWYGPPFAFVFLHQWSTSRTTPPDWTLVPINWRGYDRKYKDPHKTKMLADYLRQALDPDHNYFNFVMSHAPPAGTPENLILFGTSGIGDVPIPLIKGDTYLGRPQGKKDIRVSFMGATRGPQNTNNVRSRMLEAFENHPDFVLGRYGTIHEYAELLRRSVFTLAPRGWSPTSFRLYEALSVGSIPVYIWDEIEWLPYTDRLDWDRISIRINVRDIQHLPTLLANMSESEIREKQDNIAELYPQWFTRKVLFGHVRRILTEHDNYEDLRKYWRTRLRRADTQK